MVEHATIGLPIEALRRMQKVLNDRDGILLLEDRTWKKRLYDQEPRDEEVHPDKIRNAINVLLECWKRAYPLEWKLPAVDGDNDQMDVDGPGGGGGGEPRA